MLGLPTSGFVTLTARSVEVCDSGRVRTAHNDATTIAANRSPRMPRCRGVMCREENLHASERFVQSNSRNGSHGYWSSEMGVLQPNRCSRRLRGTSAVFSKPEELKHHGVGLRNVSTRTL